MLKRIASYLKPYRKQTVLAVLCVALETMFELVIPLIMADIIDIGVKYGDQKLIFERGALMLVCAVISVILGIGSARFSAVCGQGLGAELRKAEFSKLSDFSFANTDRFQSSSLITRMTSDITTIQNSVTTGLRPGVRAPVMMLTSIIISFTINAKLAVVFLVAAPLLGVMLFMIIKNVRPLFSKMQRAIDRINLIIQENLRAIRVVKAYVREDTEVEKFEDANAGLKENSERAFKLAALNMPAMQLVMYMTILCILWFGGKLIGNGSLEVGALTGFLSYVLQVLNSLMMISSVFMMLTRSLTSARRVFEVIDEKIDITDDKAGDFSIEHGDIEFKHVYFKYKSDSKAYVLSDINFKIESGQTIGIIGPTGSAKSTLVQLIPRLYDVTSGDVLIDGRPVDSYKLHYLRDKIAMVLQKNTLFSGTVIDNLKWGKEDATAEEIDEACRVACADEFIDRLSDGFDTMLGQSGVNLSGGQKQRLCIARAVLKKPRVLILDDSTSAVDTATEARIRKGLRSVMPNTTKIIIAQRISSVSETDKIIVMDEGKISAIGTHEQLLGHNPIYTDIYNSQKKGGDELGF